MVQALVDAGRKSEAAERARKFKARFPSSMLVPAVEAMVAE
jgi:hypothetical protein